MLGYIKLHRELEYTSWYPNSDAVRVFIHLLLKASSTQDYKLKDKHISAGQYVSSLNRLAKEISFDKRRLKKAIDVLVESKSIVCEDFGNNKIFTITNWSVYQCEIAPISGSKMHNLDKSGAELHQSEKTDSLFKEQEREKERYIIYNNISKEKERFTPPSMEEVADYVFKVLSELKQNSNASLCENIATRFRNYYSSTGWCLGGSKMTSWEGVCRNWVMNEGKFRR